jgi:MFS family permease
MGMILGGVAALTCLVALILAWILYHRDRKSVTLWHAIMCTVGFLFGLAVAAWGANASAAIGNGQPSSSGLGLLAFMGSLILAIYFAGAAFWLILYKPTHLCRITSWRTSDEEWNRHMPDAWSLEKAWIRDRRLINWLVVLAIIAAVCFLLTSYITFTVAYNRYQFASVGIYIAAIGLILFGWLMIYWAEEAFEWKSFGANHGYSMFNITFLKYLGIAGIVIGVLAILVTFLKNRTGMFIIGMLSILFFILTITITGLLLRNIWQQRTDPTSDANCQAHLAPIHADSFSPDWCPSKYLADGVTCRKQDTVINWEAGNGQTSTLNPACCKCVKEYYIWPFYILGIYALLSAICALVLALFMFYLSDNTDSYGANRTTGLLDYLFLGIALLLCIGFGAYFIFRNPNTVDKINPAFNSFNDSSVSDPNFERVKDSVIARAAAEEAKSTGNFEYDTVANPPPTFNTADATCGNAATCVMRTAILARNAKIVVPSDLSGARLGSENSRLNFFEGCTNEESDYLFLIGTEDQIGAVYEDLEFDLIDSATPNPQILTFNDQQNPADLGSISGLLSTETASGSLSSSPDESTCGNNLTEYAYTPEYTTLKGQLYYIDHTVDASGNQDLSHNTNVTGDVVVSAYKNGEFLKSGTVLTGGIYEIEDLLINRSSDYPVVVKVEDSTGAFQTNYIDAIIPASASSEVSSGKTQLTTVDGLFCAGADTACLNARESKTGTIVVNTDNT